MQFCAACAPFLNFSFCRTRAHITAQKHPGVTKLVGRLPSDVQEWLKRLGDAAGRIKEIEKAMGKPQHPAFGFDRIQFMYAALHTGQRITAAIKEAGKVSGAPLPEDKGAL